MRKRNKGYQNPEESPVYGRKSIFVNLAGILAALAIALGVLLLVQNRLAAERLSLLNGGGKVEVPVQAKQVEAQGAGEIEITITVLTEEELIQAVEVLESPGEPVYHEPMTGQLSMAQAVECGKKWMMDFLLPELGISPADDGEEYRAACFLWTSEENDGGAVHNPQLSFWAVSLDGPGVDAMLTLNAVTGQILNAAITSSYPVEYQDQYSIIALLEDYMDSFGLEADYSRLKQESDNCWKICRDNGEKGINAAVRISTQAIAVSKYDSEHDVDFEELEETVYIHLYLEAADTVMIYVP